MPLPRVLLQLALEPQASPLPVVGGIIVSPDEVRDYGDRVNAQIIDTVQDVDRAAFNDDGLGVGRPTPSTYSQWQAWWLRWQLWWRQVSWFDRTFGGTYDEIERWHQELQLWRVTLAAEGVHFTHEILPPDPVGPFAIDLGTGTGMLVAVGLGLAFAFFSGRNR